MKPSVKQAFAAETDMALDAYRDNDYDEAFRHLERAHILGQRYFVAHMSTHWLMLKVALKRSDAKEIRGQIMRMIAVIPGYIFGWVPKGNTGGTNVSALKPMPIPEELESTLQGYNVWKDVLTRTLVWCLLGLAVWLGLFVSEVRILAGETRTIVSSFQGACEQMAGFNGAEDIVYDREHGLVYAVGGDRRSFRSRGPGRAEIWVLPFDSDSSITATDISPSSPKVFRSFGMDLHIDKLGVRRLLVANRPDDGHSVEVFQIESSGNLIHERTLRHPLLKNPNDLVAIGPSKALVTLDKEADSGTLGEILEGALQRKTGKVLLIDNMGAEIVAERLQMANGIALSPSGRELYVGETIAQRLSVFAFDPIKHSLVFDKHIQLNTGVDNITVNPDGRVFIAGHPKLLTLATGYQKSESSPSPSEVLVYDPRSNVVKRLYVNDGLEHSGGSVAVVDEGLGRMLLGSAFGPHILSCKFDRSDVNSL